MTSKLRVAIATAACVGLSMAPASAFAKQNRGATDPVTTPAAVEAAHVEAPDVVAPEAPEAVEAPAVEAVHAEPAL